MTNRKAYLKAYHEKRNGERRKFLDAIKLIQGCRRCGYRECAAALEFHHLRDKKYLVGSIFHHGLAKVLAEIAKCEVLCSNCHRIETHTRKESSNASIR